MTEVRRRPVDLDQLENEIGSLHNIAGNNGHRTPPPQLADYESTALPEPNYEQPRFGTARHTSIQVIGHAITRLTWKEAEKMGAAIQAKMKDGTSLTSAIQAWAEEWEKFEEGGDKSK